MAITQQGWRAGTSSGGGGGGLTELPIENTIYVSKNGNDGTGQRNRLDKPFLTIAGANSVAQAGDCVYVYAGTYAETGDTFLSAVFYHLEDGASVSNSGSALVFDDGDTPKSINIYGNGRLSCSGGTCVNLLVSTANIECYSITGIGGMALGGQCNIRVRTAITSTSGTGIDLRNNATGYIEFDSLIAGGGASGILANTDTNDELYIKGRFMSAEPNKGAGYGFWLTNTGNQIITFEILQYKQSVNSELVGNVSAGKYYFLNCNFVQTTGNAGFNTDTSAELEFENCSFIITTNTSFRLADQSRITARNCQMQGGTATNVIMGGTSNLYLQDCVLKTSNPDPTSGANITVNSNTVNLILANTQLINEDAGGGGIYCLYNSTGLNCDIRIQGIVVATFPTDTDFTNIVTGTNIIVDSDVKAIPSVTNP